MADLSEIKRNAVTMFANVVRTSTLQSHVNSQQIQMVMMQFMESLDPALPLDFTPLFNWLKEQKYPIDSIYEVLFFFKTREEKLGFVVQLPAEIEKLPDAKKQKILDHFKRPAAPTTYSGAREPEPAPGKRENYDHVVRKRRGPSSKVVLAVSLLLSGGASAVYWALQPAPVMPRKVVVTIAPPGLTCKELVEKEKTLMCRMEQKAWDALTPEARAIGVTSTKEQAAARGYKTVLVQSIETRRLLGGN